MSDPSMSQFNKLTAVKVWWTSIYRCPSVLGRQVLNRGSLVSRVFLTMLMLIVSEVGAGIFTLACASSLLPQLSVSGVDAPVVELTQGDVTSRLHIPTGFFMDIDELYDEVYVMDLDGNGVDEVIFHLAKGSVNSCSRVLKYDGVDGLLHELKFAGGELCNIKEVNGHLVSSYRVGGAWVEDVYDFVDGYPRLIVSDACIGCGEVQRRELTPSGSYTQFLVSDGETYSERKPIVAQIRSVKAKIYASPDVAAVTKKYLVRGDRIKIVGYEQSDQCWLEFRYFAFSASEGWLRCSDVGI